MRIRPFSLLLLMVALVGASELSASPATVTGELGEGMARTALDSPGRTVVEVQHGRHGMDFLYYEPVDGREVLHVSEVKAGGSQQAQKLALNPDELALLNKHGIVPESLGGNRYQITQGSHGYNLVQIDRALRQQAKMDGLLATLKTDGIISNQDAKRLAVHLRELKPALSPVETNLLERAAGGGDTAALRKLIQTRQPELTALNQQASQQLRRVEQDIAARRYTNQLIRVRSVDGRAIIEALPLDAAGKASGQPREIRNLNWKYLRESGPFRRLVKDEIRGICANDRRCTETAYKTAKQTLETGGEMNQAMRLASEQARPMATPVRSAPGIQHIAPVAPPSPPQPVARPASAELRKAPLLTRVRQFVSAKLGSAAGKATSGFLMTAVSVVKKIPFAGDIVNGIALDIYLDDKIGTYTQDLKTHLGTKFNATNQHIAQWGEHQTHHMNAIQQDLAQQGEQQTRHMDAIQQDIAQQGEQQTRHMDAIQQDIAQWGNYQSQYLQAIQQDLAVFGEQSAYRDALILETLDRQTQTQAVRMDALGTQMDQGFAGLSQALLAVELKQDYGLALQEAQFDDALQSGLKHYDVYLGTADRGSLAAAEKDFTQAQARYENLLTKHLSEPERLRGYRMQHALSSYYRALVYAERAADDPRFAEQAVQTFIAFADQVKDPEHLNAVLPILNYAYVSIADVDQAGLAGEQLTQAYAVLIDDDLAHGRFNQAVALAAMLQMARDDDSSRLLDDFVRYVAGVESEPPEHLDRLQGDWLDDIDQRERPRPGTAFALLACAESLARREAEPGYCDLTTEELVAAADAYDSEIIHRYLVERLIRSNRLAEARRILDAHYIADTSFRIRSQLTLAYFQRDASGEADRYCRMGRHVMADQTFPDDLRQQVREHLEKWGGFCRHEA